MSSGGGSETYTLHKPNKPIKKPKVTPDDYSPDEGAGNYDESSSGMIILTVDAQKRC